MELIILSVSVLIGYDNTHPPKPPLCIRMAFGIAARYAPDKEFVINSTH